MYFSWLRIVILGSEVTRPQTTEQPTRPHITIHASVRGTPRAVLTASSPALIVPSHLHPLHTAYLRSFMFLVFPPSPPYKRGFLGSPSTSGFLTSQENDVIFLFAWQGRPKVEGRMEFN